MTNPLATNTNPAVIATPSRSYPIARVGGRIKVMTTPTASTLGARVYEFVNKETSQSYGGKTGNFSQRMAQHTHDMNCHAEKSKLTRAVSQNPDAFRVNVYSPKGDLEQQENELIIAKDAIMSGYNQRKGGGGGGVKKKRKVSSYIDPKTATPQKYFPLEKRGDRIVLKLTPETRSTSDVSYVFKDRTNNKRYIGETEQSVAKRASQHLSAVNHPETDRGKLPLYQEIRKNPENFDFGIFPGSVAEDEKALIEAKESKIFGFNQNSGGGGSGACRSLKF